MATFIISVGSHPRPSVKSKYLYVQEGSRLRAVARFTSEENAEYFKSILLGVLPVHIEEDDD